MYKKLTKKDQVTIINAYTKKCDEYSKMSLQELKDLYPTLGGSYKQACIQVVQRKLQTEKKLKLEEAINDAKSNIQENQTSLEAEIVTDNIESNESNT